MKFGLFYEHNLPRPWGPDDELTLFQNILEQVELADRVGFQYVWQVEHHFLEEYAHSSAPEVLLAAYSQRTKNIRLGHGIVQTPPHYNHPARIAERIATLDLISNGRVEFGTGESSSLSEMGGFNLERDHKRPAWREGTELAVRLMTEEPFTGHEGPYLSMPPRNCVPKPVQKPHPPLWVACSQRDTIHLAAQNGMGALTFAFINADEARHWVDDYYRTIADECVPIGKATNPNVAIVTPLMCCESEEEAKEKGEKGANFFGYALAWYYVFGSHQPGRTSIWESYEQNAETFVSFREQMLNQAPDAIRGCVGTPEQIRGVLRSYEEAGVDQVIFFSQAGHNRHEDICASYEKVAREVLPEFRERDEKGESARRERAEGINEKALKRKADQADTAPPLDESYTIDSPMAGQGGTSFF
jgi:alkanesulfonate monooxygenase SsuD/methylene tetrahydromethanopterin reductase-like flavin-dependent oxidoreductase (luciferase family)